MEIYVVSKAENGVRSSLFAWPAFGHVTSFRKTKTSDFFDTNLRTFEAKPPYFCPKKSDVLCLPENLNIYNPIKFDGGCRVFVIHAQPPSRV